MNILANVVLVLILSSWVLVGIVDLRWIVEKLRELRKGDESFQHVRDTV